MSSIILPMLMVETYQDELYKLDEEINDLLLQRTDLQSELAGLEDIRGTSVTAQGSYGPHTMSEIINLTRGMNNAADFSNPCNPANRASVARINQLANEQTRAFLARSCNNPMIRNNVFSPQYQATFAAFKKKAAIMEGASRVTNFVRRKQKELSRREQDIERKLRKKQTRHAIVEKLLQGAEQMLQKAIEAFNATFGLAQRR